MKLYDFQKQGVEDILKAFETKPAACLSWYTGAGKTNVFSDICRILTTEDPKIKIGISAYITREIKEQVYERLNEFGLGQICQMIVAGVLNFS